MCLNEIKTDLISEINELSEHPNELPLQMDELFLPQWKESMPGPTPEEKAIDTNTITDEILVRQAGIINQVWPSVTKQASTEFPAFAHMFEVIKKQAAPNFIVAKIPVKSGLVISKWESELSDYHDKLLCKFLKFGWPLGYHKLAPPHPVTSNHPSAIHHMHHV